MSALPVFDPETEYVNPATGKGWTPREEGIIEQLMSSEECPRPTAIQIMRRRKLDDLKGGTRPSKNDAANKTIQMPNVMHKSPIGVCRGCGVNLKGKRKGALFCSDACRMRHVRLEHHN
jgi:hypothetical protein